MLAKYIIYQDTEQKSAFQESIQYFNFGAINASKAVR